MQISTESYFFKTGVRRATFCKKLVFQKINIPHYLLFLKNYLFIVATFSKGVNFCSSYVSRRATFSKQVLLRNINFFRRATFWKKLIFQKSNITHYLLYLESYLFVVATFSKDSSIAATFSEEPLFHNILFRKMLFFRTANFVFCLLTSFSQLHFLFII